MWTRVCVSRRHDSSSPHTSKTFPKPFLAPPTPRLSFSSSRAQCHSCLSGHLPAWQLTHNCNSQDFFFFFLPHICYSAFYLPFFFFLVETRKLTNTEKLFGIFNCIKTFFYLLFKELCDFSS